ncbi:hypothetical protein BGX31_002588 [Mortierella sp. GBA43]|nr:hypothetical protein BGX31_002588 [Mortierella sp. GBA43]
MVTKTDYDAENNLNSEILKELNIPVPKVSTARADCWNTIVNPGIGLTKSSDQNLQFFRRLPMMIEDSVSLFPRYLCLIEPSRKAVIGQLLHQLDATKRTSGAAAACAASEAGEGRTVRVHDVKAIGDVIMVSDSIWRAP